MLAPPPDYAPVLDAVIDQATGLDDEDEDSKMVELQEDAHNQSAEEIAADRAGTPAGDPVMEASKKVASGEGPEVESPFSGVNIMEAAKSKMHELESSIEGVAHGMKSSLTSAAHSVAEALHLETPAVDKPMPPAEPDSAQTDSDADMAKARAGPAGDPLLSAVEQRS